MFLPARRLTCPAFAQSFTVITRSRTLSSKLEYAWQHLADHEHLLPTVQTQRELGKGNNCMQLPCWNRACVSAMSKKRIKDGLLKSLHTIAYPHPPWEALYFAMEVYCGTRDLPAVSIPTLLSQKDLLRSELICNCNPTPITETQPDPTVLLISLISRRIPISNLCFFGTGGLHFTTLQTKKWHIGSPLWFPLRQTKYDLTAIVSSWLLTHPQNKAWELEL